MVSLACGSKGTQKYTSIAASFGAGIGVLAVLCGQGACARCLVVICQVIFRMGTCCGVPSGSRVPTATFNSVPRVSIFGHYCLRFLF